MIFSSSTDESVLEKSASVKMIDFAHVWPAEVVLVTDAVHDDVVLMVMVMIIRAPHIVESWMGEHGVSLENEDMENMAKMQSINQMTFKNTLFLI